MKILLQRAIKIGFVLVVFSSVSMRTLCGAVFEDAAAGLPGVRWTSVGWGDYDGDDRLDILLSGMTPSNRITQVLRNTGQGFTNAGAGLPGIDTGNAVWGDYDNDGKLDILLTGNSDSGRIAQVWHNTGSGFSNIVAGLPGIISGSASWADYDNDGKLDILLAGSAGPFSSGLIAQVWRNTGGGIFSNINAGFPGLRFGLFKAIDYDNDGWLDILLVGESDSNQQLAQMWRNTGNGFNMVNIGLNSSLFHYGGAFADYDNDGWLDVFLSARNNEAVVPYSELWRNDSGVLAYVSTDLPGLFNPFAAWGDYDSDGRSDLLLTGYYGTTTAFRRTYIFKNNLNNFTNVDAGLPGISSGSAAWGDYNNDGKLDVLLAGHHGDGPSVPLAEVWRNVTATSNTIPMSPDGLAADVSAFRVKLHWNSGADAETPIGGLSYNLRLGTTPGGIDIVCPQSSNSGFRFVPQLGNCQMRRFGIVNNLAPGRYYWSVQTIDTSFAGSPFAAEQTFVMPPVIVRAERRVGNELYLEFRGRPGAAYILQMSTNLTSWSDLRNLTAAPDGTFDDTETVANGDTHGFYQLREP